MPQGERPGIRQLLAPHSVDPSEAARGRLLVSVAIATAAVATVFLLVGLLEEPQLTLRFVSQVLAFALIAAVTIVIVRQDHVAAASVFWVACTWVAFTWAGLTTGGLSAPALGGQMVVVVVSGMLLGWQVGLIVAGAGVVVIAVTAYAQAHGVLPPAAFTSPLLRATAWTAYLVGLAFLLSIILRALDRRRAESERLATIVSRMSDAVVRFDRQWRYTFVNDVALGLLGKSREELLGREVWEVFPGLRGTESEVEVRRAMDSGQPTTFETRAVAYDGWIEVRVYPIEDGVAIFYHDITKRVQAEKVSRDLRDRLQADLEAMTKLQSLGRLFVREGNLRPVLTEVVDVGIAITHADFGNCQLLDRESGDRTIVVQRGFSQWWVDYWNESSTGRGACGTALDTRQQVIIEDVTKSPVFVGTPDLDAQLRAEVRAVVSTPFLGRSGEPLGMISVHFRRSHRPDDRTLALLNLLAGQAADIVESARADEARREQSAYAQALNHINDAIHSTFDFSEIMNRVVIEANTAFGSESASIVVKEDDGWTVRYATGFENEIVGERIPEEQRGFMEAVEQASEPLVVEDATKDPRLPAGWVQRFSFRSFLAVPLSVRGEMLGVMFFNFHREAHPISGAKADFARRLSPTVSLALGNSRLYDVQRELVRLNQALNSIDQDIHSTLATEEVFGRVVSAATNALGAESAAMGVRRDHGWVVRYEYRLQEGLVGRRFSDQELQIARRAIDQQDVQVVDDAAGHPEVNQETRRLFDAQSLLVVPLIAREEVVGVIYFIYHSHVHRFSEGEADFARRLSVSLGLAIVNARLFEAERANREREEALKSVAQAASASLDPTAFAARVSETVARLFDAKQAQIRLLDSSRTVLEPTGAFDPAGFLQSVRIPVDSPTETARVFRTGDRVVATCVDESVTDESKRNAASAGIGSYILAPIKIGSEAVGILYIGWAEPRAFSDEELSFFDAVMGQLKSGLQNARLYATERDIADRLQEALLTLPDTVPGVEFANAYHSASEAARVGGDFYDLFPLNHDHVGVVIGDVAGKGLDAAVLTSIVKNTLRAHATERGKTPKQIVTLTNDVLYRATPTESFVTVFFGILDCRDGRLVYGNAGHTTAVIVRQDGSAGKLAVTGPLLGAFADVDFDQAEACLDFDETLLLYTDGLTEARRDGEQYGEERLFAFLQSRGAVSAGEVVHEVVDEVVAFTGNRLRDDLALLAVKRVRQGAETPRQQKLQM